MKKYIALILLLMASTFACTKSSVEPLRSFPTEIQGDWMAIQYIKLRTGEWIIPETGESARYSLRPEGKGVREVKKPDYILGDQSDIITRPWDEDEYKPKEIQWYYLEDSRSLVIERTDLVELPERHQVESFVENRIYTKGFETDLDNPIRVSLMASPIYGLKTVFEKIE